MSKGQFDIKAGALFPWYFQLLGGAFTLTGVVFLLENFIVSLILVPIGLLILTGRSGIEINIISKTYRSYYSFFFLKSGKQVSFNKIEKLYINANKVTQKVYTAHTTQSSTFESRKFDAYIKFDNGNKEYLCSSKDLSNLKNQISPLAKVLNISITDNTTLQ
ncbi:MAG: hypothetical protein AAF843_00660 [Bacteroidota bacterium]